MNLVGEESSGAQLFSTSEVLATKEHAVAKKVVEDTEKAEKLAKKVQVLENKQKKEVEV